MEVLLVDVLPLIFSHLDLSSKISAYYTCKRFQGLITPVKIHPRKLLGVAARDGNYDIMMWLSEGGRFYKESAYLAGKGGDMKCMKVFLRKGQMVSVTAGAARVGNVNFVRDHLEKTKKAKYGWDTVFNKALRGGNMDVINLTYSPTIVNRTSVLCAYKGGNTDAIRLIRNQTESWYFEYLAFEKPSYEMMKIYVELFDVSEAHRYNLPSMENSIKRFMEIADDETFKVAFPIIIKYSLGHIAACLKIGTEASIQRLDYMIRNGVHLTVEQFAMLYEIESLRPSLESFAHNSKDSSYTFIYEAWNGNFKNITAQLNNPNRSLPIPYQALRLLFRKCDLALFKLAITSVPFGHDMSCIIVERGDPLFVREILSRGYHSFPMVESRMDDEILDMYIEKKIKLTCSVALVYMKNNRHVILRCVKHKLFSASSSFLASVIKSKDEEAVRWCLCNGFTLETSGKIEMLRNFPHLCEFSLKL
jgi:hypothetical protein